MKTKNKKSIFILSISIIIVAICIIGFFFYLEAPRLVKSTLDFSTQQQRFEQLNKAKRDIINNTKFSEDDVNKAMDAVLNDISQEKGIAVDKIYYDEKESNMRLNNPFEISSKDYMVIGINRNPNTYTGDGYFTGTWYYLIKDSSDNWTIVDVGKP